MATTYVTRTSALAFTNKSALSDKGVTITGIGSWCITAVGDGSVSVSDPVSSSSTVSGTYKNGDGTVLFSFSGNLYPMEVTYSGSVSKYCAIPSNTVSIMNSLVMVGHTAFLPSGGFAGVSYEALTSASKSSPKYMYARTRLTWSVQFDANGGSGGSTSTKLEGATGLTAPTADTVTKSGYTLLGWSTSSTATSADIAPGGAISTPVSSLSDADLAILSNGVFSKKYYAVWVSNYVSIAYKKGTYGTGTDASDSVLRNTTATLRGAQFTRTDYLQTAWASDAAGTTKAYDLGASVNSGSGLTLYPYWTYTTHTLTLASNDTTLGTVSGGGSYGHGRTAAATASPNLRIATFTKWSDNTTTNPKSVTMDADKSFTATFTANVKRSYTYGVQNSSGMGGYVALNGGTHVTSSSTVSNVTYGTALSFETGCSDGYEFKRWAIVYRTLAADGTVGSVDYTCYPDWASAFDWSAGPVDISVDSTTGVATVTSSPTGAYQITKLMAEFKARQYTISTAVAKTASAYGRWDAAETPGSVSGGGTYDYNTPHNLTVTEESHYSFAKWQDETSDNPRSVTVSGDATYTAYFTGKSCTLTLKAAGNGSADFSDGGSGTREYGTKAKIKATAYAHYKFSQWTDGSTDVERTVNVAGDAEYTAVFVVNDTVTINTAVTPARYGSVSVNGTTASSKTVNYDSTVTLVATPADSTKEFVQWSDGETDATRTFTADTTAASVTYTAEFRLKKYSLTVSGTNCTVAKSPNQTTYDYGTEVTLSVTPNAHYHFAKWSDNDTSNPRVVTVTGAASYSAVAEIDYHTVTASASPSAMGSVSQTLVSGTQASGTYSYAYGSVVELEATAADANHQFVDWSDGETAALRRITVGDSDVTLTARFAVKQYTLTVSTAGGGTVAIEGKTGTSANFDYRSPATIVATASEYYNFSKWTSDGTDYTENPKTVTVTGNATYAATFAAETFVITANASPAGKGTVTGGGTYGYGSPATLVATAADHYDFLGWYDSDDVQKTTETTYRPIVTAAATYTAKFAKHKHDITVTKTGKGTVPEGGSYDYGSPQTFTATADEYNHFVKWTKDGSDYATTATITVSVAADATYCAVFAVDTHTVTVGVRTAGTGTVSPSGAVTKNYGDTFQATATAATSYHFRKWYRGGVATDMTNALLEVTVTGDVTYEAEFTIGKHQISASVTPAGCGGSVTGTGKYNEGDTATLTAVKGSGSHYHFSRWSDGNTSAERNVTVTGPASFTAEFVLDTHTLTVESSDGTKGTVSGGGVKEYTTTADYCITATPAAHCHFTGWRKGSSTEIISTETSIYVPLTENTTYTGVFASDTYTISVSAVGMGTATGGGTFAYNSSHQITAQAEDGYAFAQWSDGSKANPRTIVVTGNAAYVATFEKRATDKGRVFSARHAALFW